LGHIFQFPHHSLQLQILPFIYDQARIGGECNNLYLLTPGVNFYFLLVLNSRR
jgi:hypothetical protein